MKMRLILGTLGVMVSLASCIPLTDPPPPPPPPTFSVNFDANGGNGTMESQSIQQGTTASLTTNAFTRDATALPVGLPPVPAP